jgi:hypothetical protein
MLVENPANAKAKTYAYGWRRLRLISSSDPHPIVPPAVALQAPSLSFTSNSLRVDLKHGVTIIGEARGQVGQRPIPT